MIRDLDGNEITWAEARIRALEDLQRSTAECLDSTEEEAEDWKARAEKAEAECERLRHALTTIFRSGAPDASTVGKRTDGHACAWCRGMMTPCPVETARLALEKAEVEEGK